MIRTAPACAGAASFLYIEDHLLSEWFKRSPLAMM